MIVKISKKIGNSTLLFEIEQPKEIEALFQAGCIASMPDRCICGSDDLTLDSKKTKGYTFVKVKCNSCHKSSDLGQFKEGGFFWKQFAEWQGQNNGTGEPTETTGVTASDAEDIFK